MELYWLLRLAAVHKICEGLCVTFGILYLGFLVCNVIAVCDECKGEFINNFKNFRKLFGIMFFSSLILFATCPSKSDLAIMFGWDAIKSDSVQNVIGKLQEHLK